MNAMSVPLLKLMHSIFKSGKLVIRDRVISAKIKYADELLTVFCAQPGNDLVVIISSEPDRVFAKNNFVCRRDLHDFEKKFILLLGQVSKQCSVNVSIKMHSIEAKFFTRKKLDRKFFFTALNSLEEIQLPQAVESAS